MVSTMSITIALIALACHNDEISSVDTKAMFLSQYSPHHDRLVRFYHTTIIHARRQSSISSEQRYANYEYRCFSDGNKKRLDELTPYQSYCQSRVLNQHDGSFLVFRRIDDNIYTLVNSTQKQNMIDPSHIMNISIVPSYLYCFYYVPMVEYISLPNLQLLSYRRYDEAGKSRATLSFSRPWPDGSVQLGRFLFDCDHHWTILEGTVGLSHKQSKHDYRIEYEGVKDGIVLPKRVVGHFFDDEGKLKESYTVEVLSLTPGPVPEREFTLAAFGLSDAVFQPYVPPWYYVQLVLVIAGLLAFCLWQWRRKFVTR